MVAPTDAWVLIRGDHGTGKELVAQSIHSMSGSSERPMIEVNCAAIPEELIESELFGHEKGSFTGAHVNKQGKFDQADGGILFFDEIGDMSLKTQAKILRILQEQKFERVGGHKTINVNVRVLAATNKNLEEEIENGNFRADLFWRLNVVPIHVPYLKERLEDIPLLVEDLMDSMKVKGLKKKSFAESAYPGADESFLAGQRQGTEKFRRTTGHHVPGRDHFRQTCPDVSHSEPSAKMPVILNGVLNPYQTNDFKEAKKRFEREYLQQKLNENEGNISKTAERIGLERSHLHKKLKSLNIVNIIRD